MSKYVFIAIELVLKDMFFSNPIKETVIINIQKYGNIKVLLNF